MSIEVRVQNASGLTGLPRKRDFSRWVVAALGDLRDAELGIRLVTPAESSELNGRYRGKARPTNVLAFPANLPPELGLHLLGDLAICAEVVRREARDQGKEDAAHWAHLVVHGVLHLLGYDHGTETAAAEMEARETRILCDLGYPDPNR